MAHERFGGAAEDVLFEAGMVSIRSRFRREVLGCVGCQFLRNQSAGNEPSVHGYRINDCMGRGEKTWPVYALLQNLENKGALTSEPVHEGSAGPTRRVYQPADSALGRKLLGSFELPDNCLQETQELFRDQRTG